MRKLLIVSLTVFLVLLITYSFKEKKKSVLLLTNTNMEENTYKYYVLNYLKEKEMLKEIYTHNSIDFLSDIKQNIIINNKSLQNILIKADYIIIDINVDELTIKQIRKYCKEKIFLITQGNKSFSSYNIMVLNRNEWTLYEHKRIANKIIEKML